MDTYKVILSPQALSQLKDYHEYILYTLLNEQAAKSMWDDAMDTVRRISVVAGSLKLCDNPKLNELGYRMIRFKTHQYVMLYRIEGYTAYVDAVYHQLQNYEVLFEENI